MRRHFARATIVGSLLGLLVGCSLLTDLSGLSGGPDPCVGAACLDATGDAPPSAIDGGDASCVPSKVDPLLLSDAVSLALGDSFTCALRATGTVACWGANAAEQLGAPGANRSTPASVPGLSGIIAITAGAAFACALDGGGEVWCWGDDAVGQLGNGRIEAGPHPPAKVTAGDGKSLGKVTAIAAGDRHACAATEGTLVCWGANDKLQLGGSMNALVPTPVAGIVNPTELVLGGEYSCVISDDPASSKRMSCWGSNGDYQLAYTGANTSAPQGIPLKLAAAGAYPIATAGWGHACARDEASSLWCWGENDYGQLGPGLTPGPPVAALQRFTSVGAVRMAAAGDDFSCIVGTDGSVRCLGENGASQLGNGELDVNPDGGGTAPHPTPTLVIGLPPVERVSTHNSHACAILAHPCPAAGGPVMCWGSNGSGELGGGSTNASRVPVSVRAP